ncbi:glycosyltransferase [Candidatus Gracilibacteria bacterium]|nr:glycosyltransferase [Candidatus Gracilibacteria bacterium]
MHKFIKYALVGVLGTAIDLGSLYFFVEFAHLPVLVGSVLSFLLAVVNNFILNKTWTFKDRSKNYRKLFIKFLMVSLVGLALTVGFMYVFVNLAGIWYIAAKVLTSGIVLTWNFFANKLWTFRLIEKILHIDPHHTYELSVIIPAYNEENRIKTTLLTVYDYLKEKNYNAEILVVNDGSKDKTAEVVKHYMHKIPILRLIDMKKNQGKGAAVKNGVEASKGTYILFIDADNSTPIEELEKLFVAMKKHNAQIAIGSRYLQNSEVKIKQPLYRVMIGRFGNMLIQLFLIDGIRDTQCGFKLFEHKSAREIFSFQKISRFGFDIEALVVAKSLGYTIVEVPVSWFNSPESRFRPIRDTLKTFKDLIYIKLNLWSGRYE